MYKTSVLEQKYKVCQLEDLMARLEGYSAEDRRRILTAYAFANHNHKNQLRESGDRYITHPLSVACILLDLGSDTETVMAGLLHDTVEDCDIPIEVIKEQFGPIVADLVDGVTKFRKEKGENKEERIAKNLQKTVSSLVQDIRIIIIKLADRLHNMITLDSKPSVTKAQETLEIFAPLAYLLGEYEIKCALEDLSFKYVYPDEYNRLLQLKSAYEKEMESLMDETQLFAFMLFNNNGIDCNMSLESKHLYGLRRRLLEISEHYTAEDIHKIHDYNALNIYLKEKKDCRKAFDILKRDGHTIEGKDRDYLTTPKSNRYMGLHSTILIPGAPNDDMLQFQFKTRDMEKINNHGITAYWKIARKHNVDKNKLQDVVRNMQFYKQLLELQDENLPAKEYMDELKHDIFTKMIYIFDDRTKPGSKSLIEMPNGSTPIDYAYRTRPTIANRIEKPYINGEEKPLDYKLNSQDHVKIIYGKDLHEKEELIDKSYASKTRRLILKK